MIISLILTTFFLDYVLVLLGEYELWSLLGLKGLTMPLHILICTNLRIYLWMAKLQLCVKQIYLLGIIQNIKRGKSELCKTVRGIIFQKPHSQSVLIFFKFVHLFLLLYLLFYLYILFLFLSGYRKIPKISPSK